MVPSLFLLSCESSVSVKKTPIEKKIPKQFGNRLKQTGITALTAQVQKTVLIVV